MMTWAIEHPFLTFWILFCALATLDNIVVNICKVLLTVVKRGKS